MFHEIIVVEGKNDAAKLQSIFPEIECFLTNGSAVEEVLPELIKLSERRELILFLDPDFPGEKIRNTILKKIDCKQAFLPKKFAISKNQKKVGIEHASREAIIEALEHVLNPSIEKKNEIKMLDLYDLHLIGTDCSAKEREMLCEHFYMGKCNSKQLLKRLNMFQINLNQVKEYFKEKNSK